MNARCSLATQTLDLSRKQLELQAIPEMDVLKAEGEVANRQQDLTVARTNLELQELYMKNAVTRSLDDPVLQEMPVVPVDHIGTQIQPSSESVQDMIADALKNRTELQESTLVLKNSELSRKTARNALVAHALRVRLLCRNGIRRHNQSPPAARPSLAAFGGAVEKRVELLLA